MRTKNTLAQGLTEKYSTLCGAGGRGELSRVSLISSTLRTPSLNKENGSQICPTRNEYLQHEQIKCFQHEQKNSFQHEQIKSFQLKNK
jgi:hypothetical protein